MGRTGKWMSIVAIVVFPIGCAGLELPPAPGPGQGYRFANLKGPHNPDRTLVFVTFSGGGMRSAALTYGVLEQLKNTSVELNGRRCRLLDEVDVICATSGGAYPAAYYVLFGDEIFQSFDEQFLKRNIELELVGRLMVKPGLWHNRSEVAVQYFDKHLFRGKTYNDLLENPRRPYLIITATDAVWMTPFEFTQAQFDRHNKDLGPVSIARALLGGQAVPGLFNAIRIPNGGSAAWLDGSTSAGRARRLEPRSLHDLRMRRTRAYQRFWEHPWVYLHDGGLVDNLAISPVLHALTSTESPWSVERMVRQGKIDRVVVIVVDAKIASQTLWAQHRSDAWRFMVDVAIKRDTRMTYRRLERVVNEYRRGVRPAGPGRKVDVDLVHVCFDNIKDDKTRAFFNGIPTRLALAAETVNRTKRMGGQLLRESDVFERLLVALNGSVEPTQTAAATR